jgi:hypothetical protein
MLAITQSPLALDGWVEFNQYKWGLEPHSLQLRPEGKDVPAIETILYFDKRGRIVMPRLNPYLPVVFLSSPTEKTNRLRRQRLSVSGLLAAECLKRRLRGPIAFQPDTLDIRAWQWRGFIAEPRYTFHILLPLQLSEADPSVRKNIGKAARGGFRVVRTQRYEQVLECLYETEERQAFTHRLSSEDLRRASVLLGEDSFRCYIAEAPNGRPASAVVVLKGLGEALGWVGGTKTQFLGSGATQFMFHHILDNLAHAGVGVFDFSGANLPTVALAKSSWGGDLKMTFSLMAPGVRTVAYLGLRSLRDSLRRRSNPKFRMTE